jgi:hypothetical protein
VNWCCLGFKGNYEDAGARGVAVIVDVVDGNPKFALQFRAVDIHKEELIQSSVPVSLTCNIGMRFCPWCGVDLHQ